MKGHIYDWIKDFLTHRKPIIAVDGHHSKSEDVTSGVPQGKVLGPLLFLLDTSNLEEFVEFENLHSQQKASFADDTKLTIPIKWEPDMMSLLTFKKQLGLARKEVRVPVLQSRTT